ncbi:MAG: hypothetical protein ACE5K0_11985 [Candidatus Methanofastidiosia archaeon]
MKERFGYTIPEYKNEIIKKTTFILELYKRYRENIEMNSSFPIDSIKDEEMKLLIISPPKVLDNELRRIQYQLSDIKNEIKGLSSF